MTEQAQKMLRERLAEWTDMDFAQFELGVCLGLFEDGDDSLRKNREVFDTNNVLGHTLYSILIQLKLLGMLETEDDGLKFRWNKTFTVGRLMR